MTQADLFGLKHFRLQTGRWSSSLRESCQHPIWDVDLDLRRLFGDVYHRRYRGPEPARRLEEYTRYPLFRTVGIDSAFYDPPSEDELRSYARALPQGFPCVSKVWDRITAKRLARMRRSPDSPGCAIRLFEGGPL